MSPLYHFSLRRLAPLGSALIVLAAAPAQAQVLYSTSGSSYTQNFDSLGTSTTWTNNTTLTGWHAWRQSQTAPTALTVSNGSSTTTDALTNYGTTAASDRTLGAINQFFVGTPANNNPSYYGLQLTNTTGSSLTQFTLTYDGEQWRAVASASSIITTLTLEYQIFNSGAGSISAASGWSSLSGADFTSPIDQAASSALDGNAAANQVAGITGTATGLSWGDTQELWVRWVTPLPGSGLGFTQGQGIDNVQFSAVPEPSTYALLGLGLGGLWVLRRNKKTA